MVGKAEGSPAKRERMGDVRRVDKIVQRIPADMNEQAERHVEQSYRASPDAQIAPQIEMSGQPAFLSRQLPGANRQGNKKEDDRDVTRAEADSKKRHAGLSEGSRVFCEEGIDMGNAKVKGHDGQYASRSRREVSRRAFLPAGSSRLVLIRHGFDGSHTVGVGSRDRGSMVAVDVRKNKETRGSPSAPVLEQSKDSR